MKNEKEFWKSKTLWANALIVVAGVAVGFSDMLTAGSVITVLGVVNMVLRIITTTKLS